MGHSRRASPRPGITPPVDPPEVINLYPNPVAPRAPVTREGTLAGIQAGFASLDDRELQLARLWLRGVAFHDVCSRLDLSEPAVRKIWRQMRQKLRAALLGGP